MLRSKKFSSTFSHSSNSRSNLSPSRPFSSTNSPSSGAFSEKSVSARSPQRECESKNHLPLGVAAQVSKRDDFKATNDFPSLIPPTKYFISILFRHSLIIMELTPSFSFFIYRPERRVFKMPLFVTPR